MAEDKKSFILYADYIHLVKKLPIDKAGLLFIHILEYVNDLNPITDDILIDVSFEPIKQQLKRDLKRYENKKIQYSEAGKASAAKKRAERELNEINERSTKSTNVDERSTKSTNVDERSTKSTVTVNDNVNVTVNDNVINNKRKEKEKTSFSPPSIFDVKEYFKESGYKEDIAEKAFNYYNIANWHDSKGNKVKNWKQKMQAVWFKEENKIIDPNKLAPYKKPDMVY